MRRRSLLAALPILAFAHKASAAEADGLAVVASFSILADIARAVGGDLVAVQTLVPVDGDAHQYQSTPNDLRTVHAAKVLVENGLGLEGWISRLPAAAGFTGIRIIAADGVAARVMTEDGRNITDPHAWQDPRNAMIYARNIANGLARALPNRASTIAARADAYMAEIARTDDWISAQFATISPAKRRILTSHDAFGYYGARYGIELRAVQGISTEGEPSAADIAALIGQIKRENIRAVFVENMTNPRLAATIARDSGAIVGPTVYSDALSAENGTASTYLRMLRYNTTQFVAAMAAN